MPKRRAWFIAWLEGFSGHVRAVDYASAGPLFHPEILAYGMPLAVAIAPWTSTGFNSDGVPFDRPGRATFVFHRTGNRWIGTQRLPALGFRRPHLAFKFQMTEVEKRMLFRDNALGVYTFR